MTGDRAGPAFYALAPGGWRDYATLLHPPYTIWHLSYVCIGWAAAPRVHTDRLGALLLAFFLAVGIGAHSLDELNGRPLGTRVPARVLAALAIISIAGATAIGVAGAARVSWSLLGFVGFGAFIVAAYNLEWFSGRFHSDAWFALAWGAFPAVVAAWANVPRPTLGGAAAGAACFALSAAQRTLSTPVRSLRRRTRSVAGTIERDDGSIERIDAASLRATPERALRAMCVAMPLVALSVVSARL